MAREYAQATAAVTSTTKSIQANADAAAKAADAAAKAAAREAEANRKAAAARAKALREAVKAAEQARQFRSLGLTAEGGKPPPTIANLLKQITQVSSREDLSANQRGVLARVRKALIDPLHKATPETREAAKGLIQAIRDGFKDELGKGPLTKTTTLQAGKILAGLGLSPELEKELRARLSSFNSAGKALAGAQTRTTGTFRGGAPVTQTNITVEIDGEAVGRATRKTDQKNRRRNPVQKRGSRRGGV